MKEDLVWLTIEGLDKRELLEGLGFEIKKSGILTLNGKEVKALDEDISVRADDVKAVVPGSLAVITDISEVEMFLD
jgi:ethanolamine utilization microcompartment shell protein EutS